MKKIRSFLLIPILLLTLPGCWAFQKPEPPPAPTDKDVAMAGAYADAIKACYEAQKDKKQDMSSWSADKIAAYQATEKLGEANKLLAGKSLDPCSEVSGKNFYDARIEAAKEETKSRKAVLDSTESVITKGLYAYVISEALKNFGGGTTYNTNGDGSPITTSSLQAGRDGMLTTTTSPSITRPEYYQSGSSGINGPGTITAQP
jgi:hypothetical protein